ncbi:MAG TPA: TolC family protein, partial [Polyangia bacterium]
GAAGMVASSLLVPVAARAAGEKEEGADRPAASSAAVHELTLDKALALAKKGNRSLAVERARLAQAETTVEQAWNVLFPTLAAQGKYTRNNRGFSFGNPVTMQNLDIQKVDQLDVGASLSTLLFAPAAYPGLNAAKASVEGATEGLRSAEDQTLFGVAQSFLTAAIADEVMTVRDSSISVSKATLDMARTRFAAGAVTKVDVDRAEIAVLRAVQAKREAELARREAYRALATLIGFNEPFKVVPPAVPTGEPLPGDDLSMVLKLRPEFRALQASQREAESSRAAYSWRWAPSISGFANARWFNYQNFAGEHHAWAAGASLDWVLFDGGVRDSQRHLQAARLAEATARAEVLQDSIRDDIANGKDSLATKIEAQRTAERSVVLARETLDLTRTQYEAGTATQIDLLTAQDALVSAEDAVARAHFDVAAAHLVLRRAAGTFPPR